MKLITAIVKPAKVDDIKVALQAAGIGMSLSFVVMGTGAFGITNASQGAIAQEVIDVIAILWALTALRVNLSHKL